MRACGVRRERTCARDPFTLPMQGHDPTPATQDERMPTPLCAVSGFPIGEGCPAKAYVVVRSRTGTRWSPLGFGYRGLQSGTHMLADVEPGPLTDYTRKLLLPGLRHKDSISLNLPRDIGPGEIGWLLAGRQLRWDSGRSSADIVEHRVGVMRVRADVHGTLVADMAGTPHGTGLHGRVRDLLGVMKEMHAEPRGEDGRVPDERLWPMVDRMVRAQKTMGPSSALMSDNHGLVGGPNEGALVDATVDVAMFGAALDAVGSGWQPSRMAAGEPDAGFVSRFHADMARIGSLGT